MPISYTNMTGTNADLKFASRYVNLFNNTLPSYSFGVGFNSLGSQINFTPYNYNKTYLMPRLSATPSQALYFNPDDGSMTTPYYFPLAVRGMRTLTAIPSTKIYAMFSYEAAETVFDRYNSLYLAIYGAGNNGSSEGDTQLVPLQNIGIDPPYNLDTTKNLKNNDDYKSGIIITRVTFYTEDGKVTNNVPSVVILSSVVSNPILSNTQNKSRFVNIDTAMVIPVEVMQNSQTLYYNGNIVTIGSRTTTPTLIGYLTPPVSPIKALWHDVPDDIGNYVSRNKYVILNDGSQAFGIVSRFFNKINWCQNIETYINYLNDWGITVIDNINDIPPPETITPPTGIENNPTPSIPAYPDDRTDIIDVIQPNITPMDFLTARFYNITSTKDIISWIKSVNFIDELKPLYTSPSDAIIACRIYNIDFRKHDPEHINPSTEFSVINLSKEIDGYSLRVGYNTIVYGGELEYIAYYGNYNDFINTKYHIYIPYVGIMPIDSGDVVNHKLKLLYAMDLVGDESTYYLYSDNNIIKCGKCQMGTPIPISYSNYNEVLSNGILSILTGVVSGNLGSIISPFLTSHVDYKTNGTTGSLMTTAFIPPYLMIDKYPPQFPLEHNLINGTPATYSGTLSNIKGYFQSSGIKLSTTATDIEKQMIINEIENGIYL